MTIGQRSRASARNAISGALSSAEASLTKIIPSAYGRKASVAAAYPVATPPAPGVSTMATPSARNGLGTAMSMRSTLRLLSGLPASVTQSRIVAGSIDSTTASPSFRCDARSTVGLSP